MVAHSFSPRAQEADRQSLLSWRPALSLQIISRHTELHSKTLSQHPLKKTTKTPRISIIENMYRLLHGLRNQHKSMSGTF